LIRLIGFKEQLNLLAISATDKPKLSNSLMRCLSLSVNALRPNLAVIVMPPFTKFKIPIMIQKPLSYFAVFIRNFTQRFCVKKLLMAASTTGDKVPSFFGMFWIGFSCVKVVVTVSLFCSGATYNTGLIC
jgi:hypothetical protein